MTKQEIILNAGAKLFAERSYHSVGIRDITKEAGVNSAMISYYFRGKSGLLRNIFSRFATLLLHEHKASIKQAHDFYELIDISVSRFVNNAKANPDIYLVGLKEMNQGTEELQNLRNDLQTELWTSFAMFLSRIGITDVKDNTLKTITFTSIMGMVFSDLLLGGPFITDDSKIDIYIKRISEMLKYGVPKGWK